MAFVWGAGGEKLTPQQVERKRDLIESALARAGDTSPVGHWTQGLARVVEGFGAYRGGMLADKAEKEGRANARAQIEALLGGGPAVSMSSMGGAPKEVTPVVEGGLGFAGQQPSERVGGAAERLRMKMIERGLPPQIAEGFLMNFQDESGLNPGINEIAPTVPGSRGGFGLYQLTGPRRVAYERFAAERGVPPSDEDAQLDFMTQELQGPESRAAQAIMGAPDAGSAAAAIATHFLRPAPEHLQRRVAEYTGGRGYEPSSMASRGADGGMSPVMQALLQASADPWVAQEYGPVIQALMGQELARQQFAMQQADPMRQLQMQKEQLEIDAMRNPAAPKPIEVGGVLLDPTTYQPIFDSRQADDPIASLRARAAEAGLQPGTSDYAAFMASGGKPENGMVIESDGQGGFRMVQGAGAGAAAGKPFTESQSKDNVFSTRARGALEVLEPRAGALTSRTERAAEYDPTGFARGFQSDDFQVAKNAGDEFLQAILRKDTGAAITEPEQRLYGTTYLPQPGDKPAVLEAKRAARQRAVAAIESGMSPAQMLAQEKALQSSSAASLPGAPPESAPVENVGPMPETDLLRKYGLQ